MRRSDVTSINNLVCESNKKLEESYYNQAVKDIADYAESASADLIIARYQLSAIPPGVPDLVYGTFDCSENALTDLKGSPRKCTEFECSFNWLQSLDGAADEVTDFRCTSNRELTSLVGGPKIVKGDYRVLNNALRNLVGAPDECYHFNCNYNKLQDLKGAPRHVGGNFRCTSNPLKSLEGAPEYIGGKFYSDQFTDEDYRKFVEKRRILHNSNDEAGLGNILDIL